MATAIMPGAIIIVCEYLFFEKKCKHKCTILFTVYICICINYCKIFIIIFDLQILENGNGRA